VILTFRDGRVVRGALYDHGGPCTTVARAVDILRIRGRSGEAVILIPPGAAALLWTAECERVDPDGIVRLEAEYAYETLPGSRREPRARASWDRPTEEDPTARADWSRALPTGGWA